MPPLRHRIGVACTFNRLACEADRSDRDASSAATPADRERKLDVPCCGQTPTNVRHQGSWALFSEWESRPRVQRQVEHVCVGWVTLKHTFCVPHRPGCSSNSWTREPVKGSKVDLQEWCTPSPRVFQIHTRSTFSLQANFQTMRMLSFVAVLGLVGKFETPPS